VQCAAPLSADWGIAKRIEASRTFGFLQDDYSRALLHLRQGMRSSSPSVFKQHDFALGLSLGVERSRKIQGSLCVCVFCITVAIFWVSGIDFMRMPRLLHRLVFFRQMSFFQWVSSKLETGESEAFFSGSQKISISRSDLSTLIQNMCNDSLEALSNEHEIIKMKSACYHIC